MQNPGKFLEKVTFLTESPAPESLNSPSKIHRGYANLGGFNQESTVVT
jgi:hypothetical protein